MRVEGLRFNVQGSGFEVQSLGLRVKGQGLRVTGGRWGEGGVDLAVENAEHQRAERQQLRTVQPSAIMVPGAR